MTKTEQIKITSEECYFILNLKPSNASEFLSLLTTTCIAKAKDLKCHTYQVNLLDRDAKVVHYFLLNGVGQDVAYSDSQILIAKEIMESYQ